MSIADKANELRRLAQALRDAASDPIAIGEIAATINQRAIDILELDGSEVVEETTLEPEPLDEKAAAEVTPITNDTGTAAVIPDASGNDTVS